MRQIIREKNKYTATLPFAALDAEPFNAFCAIGRTIDRWSWFEAAEARDATNNTQLGTLNHLPLEIRDLIYRMVLDDALESISLEHKLRGRSGYDNVPAETVTKRRLTFQPCHSHHYFSPMTNLEDVLDLHKFLPVIGSESVSIRVREVSQSLMAEFDDAFLHCTTIRFRCPKALGKFLKRLTPHQTSCLQKVIIQILDWCDCCYQYGSLKPWMRFIKKLPSMDMSSLRSISFGIGWCAHHPNHGGFGFVDWAGNFIVEGPIRLLAMQELISTLELVTKVFKRLAPRAEITLSNVGAFSEKDQVTLGKVLEELD